MIRTTVYNGVQTPAKHSLYCEHVCTRALVPSHAVYCCCLHAVRDMENFTFSAAYSAGYLLIATDRSMHGHADSVWAISRFRAEFAEVVQKLR